MKDVLNRAERGSSFSKSPNKFGAFLAPLYRRHSLLVHQYHCNKRRLQAAYREKTAKYCVVLLSVALDTYLRRL